MSVICQQLRDSSAFVQKWLMKQPAVKEESITDWLLYDLSEKIPHVWYRSFTRHEEAHQTGADWEWWVLYSDCYLRFRVQAKKVSPHVDNYNAIARSNTNGLQIEMLLQSALDNNAIALYALYSAQELSTKCRRMEHPQVDGVYLASAFELYQSFIAGARQRINADSLLAASVPFSCIACCPLTDPGGYVFGTFIDTYLPSGPGPLIEGKGARGVHSELPQYVSALMDHESDSKPDLWEMEYGKYLRDFDALLIIDMRRS